MSPRLMQVAEEFTDPAHTPQVRDWPVARNEKPVLTSGLPTCGMHGVLHLATRHGNTDVKMGNDLQGVHNVRACVRCVLCVLGC